MSLSLSMPILVVDDTATMTCIIGNLLSKLGFTNVDTASDGSTALTKMTQKRYRLVISDWKMKPMSGHELLMMVRAEPELADARFIMVTSESKIERVIAAKKAGVDAYIGIPFTAATLKSKIEEVFKAEIEVAFRD
jgi:two-component system, chemotaxis family, chemotaxis protein CheY